MACAVKLKFADNFDWSKVLWSEPDSLLREICSYCYNNLPKTPLMLWKEDGTAMALCDECVDTYVSGVVDAA